MVDKKTVKMLDGMDGKEVWQFVEQLKEDCDYAAVHDFFENYHPHMCYHNHNKAIDFQNEQTVYLSKQIQKHKKIVMTHKRELVKNKKHEVIGRYNDILCNFLSLGMQSDIDEYEATPKMLMGLYIIRYDRWCIKFEADWDEIIGKVSDMLSKYGPEALSKNNMKGFLEKTREVAIHYRGVEKEYDEMIGSSDKEVEDSDNLPLPKEQMKKGKEWFESIRF